ncbi:flagellar biosynthesis anti-sigma factor FlgM [Sphingomonas lacunae]|uniref:Flagellar biosynthesis anti-sigma factor FlgM n=1 Tax=Sphingomonas lacunae TaxID=2698828 RepID=A0A6M4ATM7_9SPHN|nr:flagellar biosynthesis anti-sigma factor FlgM [Sphingomonas lacunae]QJQ32415.1 flagellar biosynthesis anti-sigma factor FlgM [Sphingomonas lacunae]
MTDIDASLTHANPWPSPGAIALDRIARLRERISTGRYAVQPLLVAEAILAKGAQAGVNDLTPDGSAASRD